jgi:hypothetical protein
MQKCTVSYVDMIENHTKLRKVYKKIKYRKIEETKV